MVLLSPRKLGLPREGGFSEFDERYFNVAFRSHSDWGRSKSEGRGLWGQNSLGTRADHSWCGWVNQGNIHSLAAVLGADDLCHSFWSGLTQQLVRTCLDKGVCLSVGHETVLENFCLHSFLLLVKVLLKLWVQYECQLLCIIIFFFLSWCQGKERESISKRKWTLGPRQPLIKSSCRSFGNLQSWLGNAFSPFWISFLNLQ